MVTTAAQPPEDLSFGLAGETESAHVRDSREETAWESWKIIKRGCHFQNVKLKELVGDAILKIKRETHLNGDPLSKCQIKRVSELNGDVTLKMSN